MNLARQPIFARRPCLEPAEGECPAPRVNVAEAARCWNLFGGNSSSKESSQNQQVAASEGSLAVGAGGKFQESGSVDLSSSNNAQIGNTALDAGGGSITITSADASVLNNALDRISELSAGFGSSLNQFVSQASSDQANKVATLLGAADAAKQSDANVASNRNSLLAVTLAVLVLIGLLIWRRK